MSSNQRQDPEGVLTHVVYDTATGRILATYRHYDAATGGYAEKAPEEVLALFAGDRTVQARLTGGDVRNLGVLAATTPGSAPLGAMRVSTRKQRLVSRPRIRLRADRDALEGDGKDEVAIRIEAVDDQEAILKDYAGEVRVTTSRGKLSARGGLIRLERGRGSIILTSVNETVARVEVRAATTDGYAVQGRITLSFE